MLECARRKVVVSLKRDVRVHERKGSVERDVTLDCAKGKRLVRERCDFTDSARGKISSGRDVMLHSTSWKGIDRQRLEVTDNAGW